MTSLQMSTVQRGSHASAAVSLPSFAPTAEATGLQLHCEMFATLAAAEPVWRELEGRAVLTPYQRFDWIAALLAARDKPAAGLAIVAVREAGRPVALLPLEIRNLPCVRIARLIGWDIGNGDWMIVDPDFARRLDRPAFDRLLAEIGALTRADFIALHSQPAQWGEVSNPLLPHIEHQPSPDHLYAAPLTANRLNAKRLRNIERGRRRLEEAMGGVRLVKAERPEEIAEIHDAFLRQRDVRFRQMGVANIFAEPEFQRFFISAARQGLGSERPALVMHALMAGQEIVATSIGSFSGDHFAQYINSTTDGPAAKYSLMGLLMVDLVEELRSSGIASIDLGLGDFEYKLDWTDQQEVFDAVVPITRMGRLAGSTLIGLRHLKRHIKQTPMLWQLATTVRKGLNSLRGRR